MEGELGVWNHAIDAVLRGCKVRRLLINPKRPMPRLYSVSSCGSDCICWKSCPDKEWMIDLKLIRFKNNKQGSFSIVWRIVQVHGFSHRFCIGCGLTVDELHISNVTLCPKEVAGASTCWKWLVDDPDYAPTGRVQADAGRVRDLKQANFSLAQNHPLPTTS